MAMTIRSSSASPLKRSDLLVWRALRGFYREMKELKALLASSAELTFYVEDSYSYLPLEGYVEGLQRPYNYVSSDPNEPLQDDPHRQVFRLPSLAHQYLSRTDVSTLVMTMPDLGSLHVARPDPKTCCLYVFHSLISIHRGYLSGAFDHYDEFFCAGPHMVEELTAYFDKVGKKRPVLHPVGYHKLDRIALNHALFEKSQPDQASVLLAPSWQKDNLLELAGETLIDSLLRQDLKVIVRPHPVFFQALYPQGQAIVAELEKRFQGEPGFVLDTDYNSERSFHEADLMLCDWSGASLEYAFGTERPVIFVDSPPKVRNPDWTQLGVVPFEERVRDQIGRVLASQKVASVGQLALDLLDRSQEMAERIRAVRDEAVFHFGRSAEVGVKTLRAKLSSAS